MSNAALDELRVAFGAMLAAERRLRGREGHVADGLSLSHFRMLTCLLDADELPAGRLAAAAELTPASTTQMLDLLEARGMVVRERDAKDRRVVVARLTEEGRTLTLARRESFRALWAEAFADLDETELAVGVRVLDRVGRLMELLGERKATRAEPVAPRPLG